MSSSRSRPHLRRFAFIVSASLLTISVSACGSNKADNTNGETTTSTSQQSSTLTTVFDPNSTTTTMRASSAVVLQGDGLGVAKLGDDAEMTISKLTTALGPISSDTGWKPIGPNSTFQACPGVEARYVDWGGLSVFFNSEDETATQGLGRRFTAWQLVETDTVTEAQLRTEKGIGINSTVDELKVAFGNRVVIKTDDDILGPSYVVYSTANPADNFGIPEFSGSLDALGKYVTQIGAGQGCGE